MNLFVAGFIGSPAMNMLEATVGATNGGLAGGLRADHAIDNDARAQPPGDPGLRGRDVVLGIRPEDLEDRARAGRHRAGAQLHGDV